eukprot:8130682-Karenia_brevis.AAC.1
MAAWCRDVLYVIAGHTAALVNVHTPTRRDPSRLNCGGVALSDYQAYKQFKEAADNAAWHC